MGIKIKAAIGWIIHVYTASSAIFGLLTLHATSEGRFVDALWWMAVTVFIDSTDGTLARRFKVSEFVPNMDGALLDNLVDYLNYVITPCFFLLRSSLLFLEWKWFVAGAVAMASVYQFAQKDAKTEDHFFKGFPCYWNIVVLYLFVLDLGQILNSLVLILLCVLVFVPVKYVYPSQMKYVSKSKTSRVLLFLATTAFCTSSIFLLWIYPKQNNLALSYALLFAAFYLAVSLYRTFNPLEVARATKKIFINRNPSPNCKD